MLSLRKHSIYTKQSATVSAYQVIVYITSILTYKFFVSKRVKKISSSISALFRIMSINFSINILFHSLCIITLYKISLMHLTLEMVADEWKLVTNDIFQDLYQSKRSKRRMTENSYSQDDIIYTCVGIHRHKLYIYI